MKTSGSMYWCTETQYLINKYINTKRYQKSKEKGTKDYYLSHTHGFTI